MSRLETPMTRWYWSQIGGLLLEEFLVVPRAPGQGRRLLDGLIVLGEPAAIAPPGTRFDVAGRDVVSVQTKNSLLGMYLMGQALFSRDLVRALGPKSVMSVALCSASDRVLTPMLEAHENCHVVVCPPEVCRGAA
ncbi:hypothetical protein [Luteimonas sp. MC1895]|uniref:hypothetical protein n=1 Tax=Luteimonas sp. MC1895 TaxID=2819513 RepID=UPI0018F0EDC0|nr:hypothetical protein [Luteimonas sp. MC1895]MBJ6979257.1 hypothetical protein [Luteimonas sp. MC1895]